MPNKTKSSPSLEIDEYFSKPPAQLTLDRFCEAYVNYVIEKGLKDKPPKATKSLLIELIPYVDKLVQK